MSDESNELALKLRDKVKDLRKQLASEKALADIFVKTANHSSDCPAHADFKCDCGFSDALSKWKKARGES